MINTGILEKHATVSLYSIFVIFQGTETCDT